ncbi:histidine phosphatase family protein [Phenylobacterium sp.]|uniref:histidine phosphatase family protein n=1 Tax=Phenylobacterium sp. TaxID=1871053 RepID=UPI00286DE15A|nr:histidine phosphatase family protein [Phenylobacterium sp.]
MIYLVRHGQTESNLARRYQGASDSPLTALGRAQARRMGELLGRLVPDTRGWRMVASPLGRAQRTAEIICEAMGGTLTPRLDPRVAEASMGSWDGLQIDELEARRPQEVPYPERYFQSPDGESFEVIWDRLSDWLGSVGQDDKVILVSHGLAGRFLRGIYGKLPREELMALQVPQDAIHRLEKGAITQIACEPV